MTEVWIQSLVFGCKYLISMLDGVIKYVRVAKSWPTLVSMSVMARNYRYVKANAGLGSSFRRSSSCLSGISLFKIRGRAKLSRCGVGRTHLPSNRLIAEESIASFEGERRPNAADMTSSRSLMLSWLEINFPEFNAILENNSWYKYWVILEYF